MTGMALGSFLPRVGAKHGAEDGVGQEAWCSPIGGISWGQYDLSYPGRARYQFASKVTHLFCRRTARIGHLAHFNLWPNPEVAPSGAQPEPGALWLWSPVHLRVRSHALQITFVPFCFRLSFLHLPCPFCFSKERNTELGLLPGSSRTHPCRHPKNPVPSLFLELWAPPPFPQGCDCGWSIWLSLF